jgi:hypothetical protein
VSVETFKLTGHLDSPKDLAPGRGFVYFTPDQTVADGASNVVVAGVKFKVSLDADGDFCNDAGDKWVVLPSGIGYHGRPILYDGYPPEADFTVPLGTVTLDWADITNEALNPLLPTGLQQAKTYTDEQIALAVASTDGGSW